MKPSEEVAEGASATAGAPSRPPVPAAGSTAESLAEPSVESLAELSDPELSAAVDRYFGDRRPLAIRFHEHLAGTGVEWGLIGPREVPRLWRRHLINCALTVPLVPDAARVIDVGSGAGLPGLVWAIARPDLTITLVEPLLRRTTWLEQVRDDLGLDVRVLRGRAEDVAREAPELVGADVVTARAVAPLAKLARWTVPLMRADGQVLALKGESASAELERDGATLRKLRVQGEVVTCGQPLEATRVIRLVHR